MNRDNQLAGRQQVAKILRIDVQSAALTGNACKLASILIRNAKTAALVVDEPVKGDFPRRTEIPPNLQRVVNPVEMLSAGVEVGFLRDAVEPLVEGTVLLIAPFQGLRIQIGHIPEGSARQKVALYKAYQPFHLPLGVRVPGLAELRLEAERVHERLVLPVPNGVAAHVAVVHNALHVVREDVFRDSHVLKSMNQANEKVLLLAVGEEFNEHVTAVVTAKREAGGLVLISSVIKNL